MEPVNETVNSWNVYRSGAIGSSYTSIASEPAEIVTYTDTSVLSGGTYFYVVTAVDTVGNESAYSASVSATIPADSSPLPPPTVPPPTTHVPAGSLPSGLALYWTFDNADISNGIVVDKSGNDNTGMLFGNAQSVKGILNEALSFAGATSYVLATYNVGGLTHSLTLAAWISTANASRTEAIFADFNAAASGAGFIFTTDQNGNLAVRLGGTDISAYPNLVTDSSIINDVKWHHVVATISFELQTIQFYVDGKLSSTTAVNMAPNGDGGSALQVGVAPWTEYGDFFTGAIDEVQVYNRALTDSEVNTIYQLSGGLR